ncbi:acetate kinase [Streptococcus pneumoniae]|nr:acetate kinase [Streptococcus pneumoniae]
MDIENHTQAVKILLDDLIRFDIIKAYDEITGVGHRVVAGGEYFKESTVVEGDVLEKVEEFCSFSCYKLVTCTMSTVFTNLVFCVIFCW